MDSKFEEWAKSSLLGFDFSTDKRGYIAPATYWAYEGWKAGRESMRDEAIPLIFGHCASDNVAQRTVDAIKAIEP